MTRATCWSATAVAIVAAASIALGGCDSGTDPAVGGGGGGGEGLIGSGGAGGCTEEVCDTYDNDCDGLVDEGCACTPGDTQECYPSDPLTLGIGACRAGLQQCDASGAWGAECEGAVVPSVESCNGEDDDCNGAVDDGSGGSVCQCPGGLGGGELVAVPTLSGVATCIDATEVTRADYQAWLETSPATTDQLPQCAWNIDYQPLLPSWPPLSSEEQLPVAGVDWCDAQAYCQGRGKRLCGKIGGGSVEPAQFDDPNADEWYNACTTRGLNAYPYASNNDSNACNGVDAGHGSVVAVGTLAECRGPSPVFDLSGNVWEWEDSCSGSTGEVDQCKVRGGSYNGSSIDLSCGFEQQVMRQHCAVTIGFRCCADPVDGG